MSAVDVHICPILMRTVLWRDGHCTEECKTTDCPIKIWMMALRTDADELEDDRNQDRI